MESYPLTKCLIKERLFFIDSFIKSFSGNPKIVDIAEFENSKACWLQLERHLDGDRSLSVTSNHEGFTLSFLIKHTIRPLLRYQKNMREKMQQELNRIQGIQEQPYENKVKMPEDEYIEFCNQYERCIGLYDTFTNELNCCLYELKH